MKIARVTALDDKDIDDLVNLYRTTYWANDRTRQDAETLLAGSDYVFGFRDLDADKLVGFARAFTDGAFLAMICDVVVDETYRGKGLGRMIMDAVVGHPELQKIKHLQLNCNESIMPFYRKWGFTGDLGEIKFMRRSRS
jgi:GNAT superfamily N-acetyltransferase